MRSIHSSQDVRCQQFDNLRSKRRPSISCHYQKLIRARDETIRNVLRRVKPVLELSHRCRRRSWRGFLFADAAAIAD